jgi:hypothetical protein
MKDLQQLFSRVFDLPRSTFDSIEKVKAVAQNYIMNPYDVLLLITILGQQSEIVFEKSEIVCKSFYSLDTLWRLTLLKASK